MKPNKIDYINLNFPFAILLMFLISFLMNFNILYSQESQEVGLISGYTKVVETKLNVSLYTTNYNSIKVEVPKESHITISLFDEYGNLVKLLLYDNIQPGIYEYDLTNQLPNGIYICRMNSGDISESNELVLK